MSIQLIKAAGYTLLVTVMCAIGQEDSAELQGKLIPRTKSVQGRRFVLHGVGILRAGLVFKVYAAALYRDADAAPADVLEDGAISLEVHYLHKTPKRHMVGTANQTLSKNLNADKLSALRSRIDKLHAAYRDGEKGGVASLTYIPGTGLIYAYNNEIITTIKGDDFIAYLDVWLGEKPSSKTLKAQLLEPVE